MIGRRELLIGAACAASAGTAFGLKPRQRMTMLNGAKLDSLIPAQIGQWKAVPSDALVVPKGDDSLAAKLYSQTVARLYAHPSGGAVMLLIAYGDTQSDQLQLHRPEVCYPAFGFNVTATEATRIKLNDHDAITGRDMSAATSGRTEHVTYWTRIGEYLPASGGEQRSAKFRSELAGIIPDGVLVRISNAEAESKLPYALNHQFALTMLQALSPTARRALIGTRLSKTLPMAISRPKAV
jgi:EpsI family protein